MALTLKEEGALARWLADGIGLYLLVGVVLAAALIGWLWAMPLG